MDEIEAIERATLAAVPPSRQAQRPGWLLPLDAGTVGRSHSAVPLTHETPDPAVLQEIEAVYLGAGLPPVFRLPEVRAFDALRAELRRRGYRPEKPSLVQTGDLAAISALPSADVDVRVTPAPDQDWASVFLAEGFDPVDGASRVALLRRAEGAGFATVVCGGRPVAAGAVCVFHGWAGVHGMRTVPGHRRRGLAATILRALGVQARTRGATRVFLQVEAGNVGAQALYARAGFKTAWAYAYWKQGAVLPGEPGAVAA